MMDINRFASVGFVGGGRVTRLLLEGWKRAASLPETIRVSDPDEMVTSKLQAGFPEIHICSNTEAAKSSLVVLAVHPPVIKDVLAEVSSAISPSSVVLSLAPVVPTEKLQSALGVRQVVRMIPNAPSAIGQGFNPVAYGPGLEPATREALAELFAPWGEAPEVPEKDLEAYALISGMGPTYMWFQWQTLRELAGNFGLSQESADKAILKMVEGAAECLLSEGKDPQKVMDMIPVEPLKEDKASITDAYQLRLNGLYKKLTGK